MTFQEWRTHYSGIKVREMADTPGVFLIEGPDPLNGAGRLAESIVSALHSLSDYAVTSSLPARGTWFVAPRIVRDDWTRTDYMDRRVDHETYYLSLADFIGRVPLERIVLRIANMDRLRIAFGDDEHANNIPLAKWDACDPAVRHLLRSEVMDRSWCGQPLPPRTICWSLSESVCVLKAVARRMAKEYTPADPEGGETSLRDRIALAKKHEGGK